MVQEELSGNDIHLFKDEEDTIFGDAQGGRIMNKSE
jgi:hypothetical protein